MNEKLITEREKAIIVLKKTGLGDREVAKKLAISYSTVRTHIERAKLKLGCNSTLELVSRANEMFKLA